MTDPNTDLSVLKARLRKKDLICIHAIKTFNCLYFKPYVIIWNNVHIIIKNKSSFNYICFVTIKSKTFFQHNTSGSNYTHSCFVCLISSNSDRKILCIQYLIVWITQGDGWGDPTNEQDKQLTNKEDQQYCFENHCSFYIFIELFRKQNRCLLHHIIQALKVFNNTCLSEIYIFQNVII